MQISNKRIELIRAFEGCRLNVYQDSGGIWTISYGHTLDVRAGDKITQAAANALLLKDIHFFEKIITDSVEVAITQEMFDALVSFVFNVGGGNFKQSTLLRKLNQSNHNEGQIMKKLQELLMNEHGELSTTNTIQLISVSTLSLGFLAALFFDKAIANDLAYTIAAIGLGTPISKGIVDYKRESKVVSSISNNKYE